MSRRSVTDLPVRRELQKALTVNAARAFRLVLQRYLTRDESVQPFVQQGVKSEIRISKFETSTNDQNSKTANNRERGVMRFGHWKFPPSNFSLQVFADAS
jgi:hypothetical protein